MSIKINKKQDKIVKVNLNKITRKKTILNEGLDMIEEKGSIESSVSFKLKKEGNSNEYIVTKIIDILYLENNLCDEDLLWLIDNINEDGKKYLFKHSKKLRDKHYGNKVYLRGLIEFTNYCKRECKYCGINVFNKKVNRYRLTKEEIINSCLLGEELGYNTFVLQGGEDPYYTDEMYVDIVKSIKSLIPECAITLSIGEKSYETYKLLKEAGVDRFLLRHETANEEIYSWLHPLSEFSTRKKCLENLKSLGYQTGAGFMVGLPNYSSRDYVADLRFIKNLEAEMVGIGPYITHKDTQMSDYESGDLDTTLLMLSLVRMLLPKVLLPATTALSTLDNDGRELGLKFACNVIMPNLSPKDHRNDYSLYNDKKNNGSESAQALSLIKDQLLDFGCVCDMGRGDSKMMSNLKKS